MPLYESVFIARQDISAGQVDTLTDDFAKIITDNGGSVPRREYWGLRNLAFRMKKNRKGHYVMFNLDSPAAAVHEMERNMRINEDVLRYMTIRVEELREEPSPMVHGKTDRDRADRRGRDGEDDDAAPSTASGSAASSNADTGSATSGSTDTSGSARGETSEEEKKP